MTGNFRDKEHLENAERVVPDTSVVIEGLLSETLDDAVDILIHEAVIAELEHQANRGQETGELGLEEIRRLNDTYAVEFKGSRPGEFEIKNAHSGEIDNVIREFAREEDATLVTADRVQAQVAQSKGINAVLYEFEDETDELLLDSLFDDETMSVHLKADCIPKAKRGAPGRWSYDNVRDDPISKEEVQEISKDILEHAHARDDGFIEIDRDGSTIVQLGPYRIVLTRQAFSDAEEITAVRPVAMLSLDDYDISDELYERIHQDAEGILISGAPGHGKSTFAQALAEEYHNADNVVKTVEAPRDLVLADDVTQYSLTHGSKEEIHDILLLSRPDFTIFDEMRNTSDFNLFSDLRLSGVGMIGVVHATETIDAVQRFIGRIDLGVIPHVIDTVFFIRDGGIAHVYSLDMKVKVPSGMTEADLARPVVEVHDFESGRLEFEIYTYGEETVVIPVKGQEVNPAMQLAAEQVRETFSQYTDVLDVEMVSANRVVVHVPVGAKKAVIGKGGGKIEKIEDDLGISIDVREGSTGEDIPHQVSASSDKITFQVDEEYANEDVDIVVNGEFLLSARVSKQGKINMSTDNKLGTVLEEAVREGHDICLRL